MGLPFGDRFMFINGEFADSSNDEWITSINPATEEIIGRVPAGTAEDVCRAVEAAAAAQPAWNNLSIWERAASLRQVSAVFRTRAEEILMLEATDTGNTITKLGGDVQIAAAYLEYFAGLGTEIKGNTVPASPDNLHMTLREPYGVVARIVPFNHPFMFASAHLAAPLTAGNTVVIKTPETSPLSGSLLAEVCKDLLPPGVVNIVSGLGLPVGDTLVRHPMIRRIGFTGSVTTGLSIQRAAAEEAVKHVSLELGGKNPMIVFPDADLDSVVDAAIDGMNFAWAGQSCGSTSRILAQENVYDEIVERVAARADAIKVGHPLDPDSEMGPVNNINHLERIQSYIASANDDGAALVAGGGRPVGNVFKKGYWIRPTVFADVSADMRIAREEIFGPVIAIFKWSSQNDAIDLANATEYGLTATVWSKDLKAALTVARRVQAGVVTVNGSSTHFVGTPFGGIKNSGLGGEEALEELLSYTQTKSLHIML